MRASIDFREIKLAIASWKFRRELIRIAQQLRGLPELVLDPIRRKRLDRAVAKGLPAINGAKTESKKVAVFLIFQPRGVSESTIEQCQWLYENGYAPLVVSNTRLSSTDIDRLTPVVWRAIIRPNFGYDFGGYRDALTSLRQWGVKPDTLLILNDSVWVPVIANSDLIWKLESDPADVAGSILRERGEIRFLESYCYRIRGELLEEPAFKDFWSSLRLTSNKYYVIRRGERGFSEAMLSAGYKIAAVYRLKGLVELLANETDEFLAKTIRYSAFLPPELLTERDALLAEGTEQKGEAWRKRALSFVNAALQKRLAYSTLPFASHSLLKYPFLKKSNDRIASEWRAAYLAAVDANDLTKPTAAILMETRVRTKTNLHDRS